MLEKSRSLSGAVGRQMMTINHLWSLQLVLPIRLRIVAWIIIGTHSRRWDERLCSALLAHLLLQGAIQWWWCCCSCCCGKISRTSRANRRARARSSAGPVMYIISRSADTLPWLGRGQRRQRRQHPLQQSLDATKPTTLPTNLNRLSLWMGTFFFGCNRKRERERILFINIYLRNEGRIGVAFFLTRVEGSDASRRSKFTARLCVYRQHRSEREREMRQLFFCTNGNAGPNMV